MVYPSGACYGLLHEPTVDMVSHVRYKFGSILKVELGPITGFIFLLSVMNVIEFNVPKMATTRRTSNQSIVCIFHTHIISRRQISR